MAQIIPFESSLAKDFKELNLEWLEEYFFVEEHDRSLLEECETSIIKPGGHIFFYQNNGQTMGTAALIPFGNKTFELGKMAVRKSARGMGIGQALLSFCLSFSKLNKYEKIVLYSNTSLENSIHIYKKYGFKEVPIEMDNPYQRGNIKMEKKL